MIRTRDLFLFLVCAGFLVVGIGITGLSQFFSNAPTAAPVTFEAQDFATTSAVISSPEIDRAERLLELQEKIATQGAAPPASFTNLPEPTATAEVNDTEEIETEDEEDTGDVQYCASVDSVNIPWPAVDLAMVEREGRRLYVTKTTVETPVQFGTTTTNEIVINETVYAHLPIRITAGQSHCIGQDVIGIAQDGSLLYNDNYVAYSIFGPETLIGYALDGLPIYGLNTSADTDVCGGVNLAGQYRYYLADDRPAMLGCFAATPVSL